MSDKQSKQGFLIIDPGIGTGYKGFEGIIIEILCTLNSNLALLLNEIAKKEDDED